MHIANLLYSLLNFMISNVYKATYIMINVVYRFFLSNLWHLSCLF